MSNNISSLCLDSDHLESASSGTLCTKYSHQPIFFSYRREGHRIASLEMVLRFLCKDVYSSAVRWDDGRGSHLFVYYYLLLFRSRWVALPLATWRVITNTTGEGSCSPLGEHLAGLPRNTCWHLNSLAFSLSYFHNFQHEVFWCCSLELAQPALATAAHTFLLPSEQSAWGVWLCRQGWVGRRRISISFTYQ